MEGIQCALIVFIAAFVDSSIFNIDPKYFDNKPLCQEINRTLFSNIERILNKQNGNKNMNHNNSLVFCLVFRYI